MRSGASHAGARFREPLSISPRESLLAGSAATAGSATARISARDGVRPSSIKSAKKRSTRKKKISRFTVSGTPTGSRFQKN